MQINVFIAKAANDAPPVLLVLPYAAKAVLPRHLKGANWAYLATTTTQDKSIGAPLATLEAGIAQHGYALVSPMG